MFFLPSPSPCLPLPASLLGEAFPCQAEVSSEPPNVLSLPLTNSSDVNDQRYGLESDRCSTLPWSRPLQRFWEWLWVEPLVLSLLHWPIVQLQAHCFSARCLSFLICTAGAVVLLYLLTGLLKVLSISRLRTEAGSQDTSSY